MALTGSGVLFAGRTEVVADANADFGPSGDGSVGVAGRHRDLRGLADRKRRSARPRPRCVSRRPSCVVRWPRSATIALGAVLLTFLLSPREWVTFGEYAALIPVLSAGIRGERRRRTISSAAYLVLLTALQYHDYPGGLLFLYGGLVWTVLFAVMWLIGDVFTAYRKAQQDAAQLALAQQRIALARDLHDTIMRSLTRLSLRVQLAEAEPDPTVLPSVAEALHQTATELRWMLTLLRRWRRGRAGPVTNGTVCRRFCGRWPRVWSAEDSLSP